MPCTPPKSPASSCRCGHSVPDATKPHWIPLQFNAGAPSFSKPLTGASKCQWGPTPYRAYRALQGRYCHLVDDTSACNRIDPTIFSRADQYIKSWVLGVWKDLSRVHHCLDEDYFTTPFHPYSFTWEKPRYFNPLLNPFEKQKIYLNQESGVFEKSKCRRNFSIKFRVSTTCLFTYSVYLLPTITVSTRIQRGFALTVR